MAELIPMRQRKSSHKKFKIGCCICLAAAIGFLIFHFQCRLLSIEIENSDRYTQEDMKTYLVKTKADQYTYLLYMKYKFSPLPSLPFVEKMDLSMKDKHTLSVKIYEKKIVGCVNQMDSYLYFDRDGLVVESTKEKTEDVPEIEGLKYEQIILYQPLHIQNDRLFTVVLNLTQSIASNGLHVDKICFNSDEEITLICGTNEAYLGRRDFYDEQICALKAVMDVVSKDNLAYDLRYYSSENTRIVGKPLE